MSVTAAEASVRAVMENTSRVSMVRPVFFSRRVARTDTDSPPYWGRVRLAVPRAAETGSSSVRDHSPGSVGCPRGSSHQGGFLPLISAVSPITFQPLSYSAGRRVKSRVRSWDPWVSGKPSSMSLSRHSAV